MIYMLLAVIMVMPFFVLWAYIKGEKNGMKMAQGKEPDQIKNPVKFIAETIDDIKESKESKQEEKDLFDKLNAINSYNPYVVKPEVKNED